MDDVNISTDNRADVDNRADADTHQNVDGTLYCANHPNVETLLRCNRCNKPICLKCAQQTSVGYRCNECIRGVQDKYYNAENWDNVLAFGIGFLIAAIAAPIVGIFLGAFRFWGILLAFFVGSSAGGILAQIIRSAIGRRRGRYLRYFALGGIIIGVLFGNILSLLFLGIFSLFSLPMLAFTILATAATYQLLR